MTGTAADKRCISTRKNANISPKQASSINWVGAQKHCSIKTLSYSMHLD